MYRFMLHRHTRYGGHIYRVTQKHHLPNLLHCERLYKIHKFLSQSCYLLVLTVLRLHLCKMKKQKTNDKTTNLNINPPTYHFKKQIKNYTNFYTKYINIKIN